MAILGYTRQVMAGPGIGMPEKCSHRRQQPIKESPYRMATHGSDLQLSDDDVAFLLTLLRNSSSPLTTAQLVEALKTRGSR
jgi:hypothetical protein